MSSFIAHAMTGSTVAAASQQSFTQRRRLIFILTLLAILPDLDYLLIWFFDIRPQIRITHSILFAVTSSSVMWVISRNWTQGANYFLFFIASLSHLVLDLLVGVHPLPLLWPLSQPDVSIPFAILPSAGKLQLTNYYLWRNLFIEMGILLPLYVLVIRLAKRRFTKSDFFITILILPLWIAVLCWSIRLDR